MFAEVKGQEESRRPEMFVDRHGREYFANVELKTGEPCEVLQPQFRAPRNPGWFKKALMPPVDDHDVVKMVPRLQRAKKGYQIEIDYDAWAAKIAKRLDAYQNKLYDGAKLVGGGNNAAEVAANPPPILKSEMGAPPFPPLVLIQAMKAGNRWALGLDENIPKKAEALLAELEQWFTKRRRTVLGNAVHDPLADDDDVENPVDEAAFNAITDDPFGALEEQHDPQGLGSQTGKPVRQKRKKLTNPQNVGVGV